MIAKLHTLFDKNDYEKGYDLNTNIVKDEQQEKMLKNGDLIKSALLDQIATGKIGSLNVEPQYLDFEALECKIPT